MFPNNTGDEAVQCIANVHVHVQYIFTCTCLLFVDKMSSDQVSGTNTCDDNDDEDNPHSPDSKTAPTQSGQESSTSSLDTPYNTPVKGNDDSLESVTEQVSQRFILIQFIV